MSTQVLMACCEWYSQAFPPARGFKKRVQILKCRSTPDVFNVAAIFQTEVATGCIPLCVCVCIFRARLTSYLLLPGPSFCVVVLQNITLQDTEVKFTDGDGVVVRESSMVNIDAGGYDE